MDMVELLSGTTDIVSLFLIESKINSKVINSVIYF